MVEQRFVKVPIKATRIMIIYCVDIKQNSYDCHFVSKKAIFFKSGAGKSF